MRVLMGEYEELFHRLADISGRLPLQYIPDMLAIMGLSCTREELDHYIHDRLHPDVEGLTFASVVSIFYEHLPKEWAPTDEQEVVSPVSVPTSTLHQASHTLKITGASPILKDYLEFCSLLDLDGKGTIALVDLQHVLCTLGDAITPQEFTHLLYRKGILTHHDVNPQATGRLDTVRTHVSIFEVMNVLLEFPLLSKKHPLDSQ